MLHHHRSDHLLGTASLLLLACFGLNATASEQHPRLFCDAARVDAIRAAAAVDGSHHARALALLRDRVDASISTPDDPTTDTVEGETDLSAYGWSAGSSNWGYPRSYFAREAAFLCRYAATPSEAAAYARKAYDALRAVYDGPHIDRKPDAGYGLSRAMMCLGFGLAYDWCHAQWSEAERDWVRGKLVSALTAWPGYKHRNLGGERESNWVAVCRTGELVALLAIGAEDSRAERYDFLIGELERHLDAAYGDLGATQEGSGYLEYGGSFLATAVLACRSLAAADPADPQHGRLAAAYTGNHDFWRLNMYLHSFSDVRRKFLQQGASQESNYCEGWASHQLALCPPADLPHYLWWYDRHIGVHSSFDPADRFDGSRAGTVWALLWYPESATAVDPTGSLPRAVADDHGYHFFRNRWQDADDILVSFHADVEHHPYAWDQSECGALGILAYGERYVGGPGKERASQNYSMLLVDDEDPNDEHTGTRVAFEPLADGGRVVVGGGEQYTGLGLDAYRRHARVRFLADTATIAVLDDIASSTSHTYAFNLSLGSEAADDGPLASSGTEAGRPFFLLDGPGDGYLKGWVLHPADATITTGDVVRIETSGTDAQILVALHLGRGQPPTGVVYDSGVDSQLVVAGQRVWYDAAADRLDVAPMVQRSILLMDHDSNTWEHTQGAPGTLIDGWWAFLGLPAAVTHRLRVVTIGDG